MTAINTNFDRVEHKWFDIVLSHLETLYQNVHLPSHDIAHHIRVWNFCKEILLELDKYGLHIPSQLVEQAFLASLFHDTGLITDKSEKHGRQSRLLCEQFFSKHSNFQVENLDDILHAIEHHDDKGLKDLRKSYDNLNTDLLTIVSTADDLDAFGHIGVYRYLEIYTLRGIGESEIPSKIIENLCNRFENFNRVFYKFKGFRLKHRIRYEIIYEFFSGMEQDILNNSGSIDYFRIAQNLTDCLINKKIDIKSAIVYGIISNHSEFSLDFYISLKDELNY